MTLLDQVKFTGHVGGAAETGEDRKVSLVTHFEHVKTTVGTGECGKLLR